MRRAAVLILLAAGTAVVVALPAWAQAALEPAGELTEAECYVHHVVNGFRSMDLLPQVISEVPRGRPFEMHLTLRNPWLADLQRVMGYVNISGAPGLSFPGEREPATFDAKGSLAEGGSRVESVPVDANATELVVSLAGTPAPLSASEWHLALESPDGSIRVDDGPMSKDPLARSKKTESTLRVDQTNLARAGPGGWKATVSYRGLVQGDYTLRSTVQYNLSRASELVLAGPDLLKPGESFTFTFTILAKDAESLNALRYGGRANAHYVHNGKSTENDGVYDKWGTMQMSTGATLRVGSALVDPGTASLLDPILRRWAEVLGFVGAFLVVPSLVLGGVMGKGSVARINGWLGGARRRALFHGSVSFWLLVVATLHMAIFLYESFWSWSHGLVWGGLALASMIGLGVTGAAQRRFVARWGFMRWRFVHFAMGVLVFVFVLIHVVADGSHVAPLRDPLFGKGP